MAQQPGTRAARVTSSQETIPAWQAALVLILLLAVLAMAAVVVRSLLFTPKTYTSEIRATSIEPCTLFEKFEACKTLR